MIKEFCTEKVNDISKALEAGAKRIELCSDLAVGGLTPSEEMIASATKLAPQKVMVMIRPKAGNYIYNQENLQLMSEEIVMAKKYRIQGIVLGCLTADNKLDKAALDYLLPFLGDLDVTFHMAFDEMSLFEQKLAIKWFAENGIYRVLVHGGKMIESITETLPRIKELSNFAKDYGVIIMPGGGITYQNLTVLKQELDLTEVHGTKIVKI